MIPSVGRIVHYVSQGSGDGVYPSVCRAAIVTEVSDRTGRPSLMVCNPTGVHFRDEVQYLEPQEDSYEYERKGTWHWPERTPE